ncbi:hypothetical protein ACE6H2_002167 [Prunus campanulata]
MAAFFQRLDKATAITLNNSFEVQLKSKFCIPFRAHAAAFGGVMTYSTGCKTPLSNFEAGQEYRVSPFYSMNG